MLNKIAFQLAKIMREVKLSSSSILPICIRREDVRGVACVALATPFFTYVYIKDHYR